MQEKRFITRLLYSSRLNFWLCWNVRSSSVRYLNTLPRLASFRLAKTPIALSISILLIFGLAGCGQTGPLYPASDHDTPQHRNDEFLLYSAPPPPGAPAPAATTASSTSTSSSS